MKVLCCGGRDFDDIDLVESTLRDLAMSELIHGAANGADQTCAKYCLENKNCKITEVPADWDAFGKSAGHKRNAEMIAMEPDFVVAFWDGKSKGTKGTIDLARKEKIITLIVYY